MIEGTFVKNCDDSWDRRLFTIEGEDIGIYKNVSMNANKFKIYQVFWPFQKKESLYFPTFKEAVECVVTYLKTLKNFNRFISDIMRLTALIKEEES